jgi:EmrB/QacA subfamily drug resistance transporter
MSMDLFTPTKRKWLVLLAIGIGTFMTALDASVVNVIRPVVRVSLRGNFASTEWVVTIYLLVLSGLLLSFGRLGDLRGHKVVYLAGFGVFVLGSALCGLSINVTMLVACRALQAVGAAMLAANSPAILTKNFPGDQRGQALGLQAMMTYLGLVAGPSVGGWLADAFGWRSVFYINVPVGSLALWLSLRFIPYDAHTRTGERFDLLGAGTFTLGLSALLLGLNQGHTWGWNSAPILFLLTLAVVLLTIFIWIELSVHSPMLDLKLFQHPVFSLSVAGAVLNYICIYSVIFLMPEYLIDGRAMTSSRAGILLASQSVVMAIIAPFSGWLSDRIGVRLPGMVGMAVLSAGTLMLSGLGAASSNQSIILALSVVGLGTGIFISPNNSALMGSAPHHRQGVAAGMLATARSFGMVLGVGLAGAIYATILGNGGNNLYEATHTSFRVAAVIASLGIFTSMVRPTPKSSSM